MDASFHIRDSFGRFLRRQPWMILCFILIAFMLMAMLNAALHRAELPVDTPASWFPISVFCGGPQFHLDTFMGGLPHVVLLIAASLVAARMADRLGLPALAALCIGIILVGNMAQGDFEAAFEGTLTRLGNQYYHDAVVIKDAGRWLAAFNEQQPGLLCHSRTHPPFAVLLHKAFLAGQDATVLTVAFLCISLLQLPLLWCTVALLTRDKGKAGLVTALYAVVPAINIYSALCLDAVIAAVFLLALLGLVLIERERPLIGGLIFALGLTAANALSFGALFLCALALFMGVRLALTRRRPALLGALIGGLAVPVAFFAVSWRFLGYNHVRAFMTASEIENPLGPLFVAEPWQYWCTRVEGIAEIVLFAGLGAAALGIRHLSSGSGKPRDISRFLGIAACATLLLMFVAGAYRTGETARACMFIYPYLLLLVANSPAIVLRDMVVWAGLQTALMQGLGCYFW